MFGQVLRFVALLGLLVDLGRSVQLKVCRRCKLSFDPSKNGPEACSFHRGRWIGAEISKHLGGRSGSAGNTGLSVFWDCCDAEVYDAPGCMTGRHLSYDEEESLEERVMLNKKNC
jgi:hypothetical protein